MLWYLWEQVLAASRSGFAGWGWEELLEEVQIKLRRDKQEWVSLEMIFFIKSLIPYSFRLLFRLLANVFYIDNSGHIKKQQKADL